MKPNFVVVYGGILRSKDMILEVLAKTSDIRDPMEILMGFVKQNNLRLMDMFTRLDKDKNCRISREEFERGIKVRQTLSFFYLFFYFIIFFIFLLLLFILSD